MQQKKLAEIDKYQLKHLGNFERLYPPQTHYKKTEINNIEMLKPETNPDQILVDEFDDLDLKQYEDESFKEIDTEQFAYYNQFLGNRDNARVPIQNIQKPGMLRNQLDKIPVSMNRQSSKSPAKIMSPQKQGSRKRLESVSPQQKKI